jgi:hypothetical protein
MEQQKQKRQMVKVSVEVRSGAARFRVGVQAPSITDALGVVRRRYPQGKVTVKFPKEPEGSFVKEQSAPAGIVGMEEIHHEAA